MSVYVGIDVHRKRRSGASFPRDRYFPPTAVDRPAIAVLELSAEPTIRTLQEFLLPLGQRIRGGEYGQLFLVVQTNDEAVAGFVRYLSREYELPIFVRPSPPGAEATPVGDLTSARSATAPAECLCAPPGPRPSDRSLQLRIPPGPAQAPPTRRGHPLPAAQARRPPRLSHDPGPWPGGDRCKRPLSPPRPQSRTRARPDSWKGRRPAVSDAMATQWPPIGPKRRTRASSVIKNLGGSPGLAAEARGFEPRKGANPNRISSAAP
jgi:hypothetical protein